MFSWFILPRLAGIGGTNRLHGKKLSHLAGCPGQVDRVPRPRAGGLPCVARNCFSAFSKEMYEKLALPGWLS